MAEIDGSKRHTGWAIFIALALFVVSYLATAVISAWAFVAALWYSSPVTELMSLPVFGLSLVFAGFMPPYIAWRLFPAADRRVVFLALAVGVAVMAVAAVLLKLQPQGSSWILLLLKYLLSMAGARLALFVDRKRGSPCAAVPTP